MFYVLDPDTILIVADMSGLDLIVQSASDVIGVVNTGNDIILSIDLDPQPSGGLSEGEVLNLIRSENVFANYKTQELDEADPLLFVGQVTLGVRT